MATTWKVTGDLPGQFDFDAAGNPITGHLISFTTGQGSSGQVFIPDVHYNTQYVRTQIHAKAQVADEIGSLASDG